MPNYEHRFKQGNPGGGRPAKHPLSPKVSMALQEAIIKLLDMGKDDAAKYMAGNPKMTYVVAWKYITKYPTEVLDRFCGKIPTMQQISGNDGEPLKIHVVNYSEGAK